jgi:2-amino-4-hydroxy-6-hydroxymethyldihydropteridine diphosphokinase
VQTLAGHLFVILLGLGANLPSRAGPPAAALRAALDALSEKDVQVLAVSRFFAAPAWPDPRDPEFVNAAAEIATKLNPGDLLKRLHAVEERFGRIRSAPNAPRTLDLDILDFEGRIESGPPILPHPRLSDRVFVLVPLLDIAPAWRHPATGRSIGDMLATFPEGERKLGALT